MYVEMTTICTPIRIFKGRVTDKYDADIIILELISPVPHDSIQTLILVSRDILLRVVPPFIKER